MSKRFNSIQYKNYKVLILIFFWNFSLIFSCQKKLLVKEQTYNENSNLIKFFGRIKFKKGNKKFTKGKIQIRIKKNKLIWISISGPFGIEIMRILINKAGIVIIDKQQKNYKRYSYKELQKIIGLKINLKIIQKIILAQRQISKSQILNGNIGDILLIERVLNNEIITNIDRISGRVMRIASQNEISRKFVAYYFYKKENSKLPYEKAEIILFGDNKNLNSFKIEVKNIKTITFDNLLDFPFEIPENY
ncbi:MAG: DUF4292 domain-containing protein [Bacteroidetes bacterium]|nr:DUF4292 domain-containing protein [Bacteroidota bacterium]